MNPSILRIASRLPSCLRFALFLLPLLPVTLRAAEDVDKKGKDQIAALIAEKEARTPAQKKMDSQLVYFAKQNRKEAIAAGAPDIKADIKADQDNRVLVDFSADVNPDLLAAITKGGGTIINHFAAFNAIRAQVPIGVIESLAARADVRSIAPAAGATTNFGTFLSQGDRTHRADTARLNTAATGTGIKIGVLSDGVNSLATAKANGDLNAAATFLPGQAGAGDEGTAMMEIVQDLVPDAQVIYATAFNGDASFAANIIALKNAGCSVIVDDVSYFNESPFQDGVIAQAVTAVSDAGVMYFSSAGNSGNKNDGTSGTWEGDFVSGGAVAAPVTGTGNLLNFGGSNFNTVGTLGDSRRVDLFWADPMGASSNDYDLFVLNLTGTTVLRSSTNVQSGTQNPYESTGTLNANERIVIVQRTGAANRFIHLDTGRARLSISTDGRVRGHNASGATNAYSVAATNVANSPSPNFFIGGGTNPVELFSTDGPRRIFFTPAGTAVTPGNFSSTGGTLLNKPDITAADGVSTGTPGFGTFFGTSAAAPHAAAIAGLLKSYNPALTPEQIRTAMTSTALDIEAAGNDRDSGVGVVMALAAIQAVAAPNSVISGTPLFSSQGPTGGSFNPSSTSYTVKNTGLVPINWTASKTQSWITLSSPGGSLAPGSTATITCSINATANSLGAGTYTDVVTITDTTSAVTRTFDVSLNAYSFVPLTSAIITGGASSSGLSVIGNSSNHVLEAIYLDGEIGVSNFMTASSAINQISFSCNTLGTGSTTVTSPNFKLYLKNVSAATTTFTTGTYSTAGYTLVYSGAFSYPTTGFVGVALNTPFVRTPGTNLQLLIERTDNLAHARNVFNTANGNLSGGSLANSCRRYNITALPVSGSTSLTASALRPAIQLTHAIPNDAAVNLVYSMGEAARGLTPVAVKGLISNSGSNTLTNLPVTLTVSGANPFTNTQIIPSLPPSGQATVTFAGFTPGITSSNTVQVSVPADDNPDNNSGATSLEVGLLGNSYKIPGSTASGGLGLDGGVGVFLGKFTVGAANAVTAVNLEFVATGATYRVAIYGANGGIPNNIPLYVDASDRTVSAAGPVTITLPSPVAVSSGNFYVGIQQTTTTNANFSYDNEVPIRSGTFFYATALPAATWSDFSPGVNFKLNVGMTLQNPMPAQDAWRQFYFGSTTNAGNAADNADPDGDGNKNKLEYVAGLVPTDPTSRFSIAAQPVTGQPGQHKIVFSPIVAGRTYVVKNSTTLLSPSWTNLTSSTTSTVGTVRTVTDLAASQSKKFYHVEITLP